VANHARGVLFTLTLLALTATAVGCGQLPTPEPAATTLAGDQPPSGAADAGLTDEVAVTPPPRRCAGYVALTFDDGPTELTAPLLAELARTGVPATFFNLGTHMRRYPDLVAAQAAAGHQVGNHSYDHPDLLTVDAREVGRQLDRTNAVQEELLGAPADLFRPPFGATDPDVRAAARDRGMLEVLWTTDTKDYLAGSAAEVLEASEGMADGDILLLHEGNPHTLAALPHIVNGYHAEGLCFGRVGPSDDPVMTDLGFTHDARAVAP